MRFLGQNWCIHQLQYIEVNGVGWSPNANCVLTIFKILDHDDYWLALQKNGDVPKIILFTYRDESPRWDMLPIIRKLVQHILPDQKIRTTACELTATLDCIRKQMEIGKAVKIRLKGAKRVFNLRPGDNESDFLKFALKHCPDFLRDFSGSTAAKVKLEFVA